MKMVWTTGWSRTPGALAGERRGSSGSREESRCVALEELWSLSGTDKEKKGSLWLLLILFHM